MACCKSFSTMRGATVVKRERKRERERERGGGGEREKEREREIWSEKSHPKKVFEGGGEELGDLI